MSETARCFRRWRPIPSSMRVLAGMLLRVACLVVPAILLSFCIHPAQATPPPNDQCFSAEVIPASGPFPYTSFVTDIAEATTSGDPPLPPFLSGPSRSIWYAFTPAQAGFYTLSSCRDAPTDTTIVDDVMAIYTSSGGCAGPFVLLPTSATTRGYADESCGPGFHQAAITTTLNANTTYYIVVWQYDNTPPSPGNTWVQLRVNKVVPPSNNTCDNAVALTVNMPLSGPAASSIGSTNNYQLSPTTACFTGLGQVRSTASGSDVVYTFTAPQAGNYSFRAYNFSEGSNLVLYVAASCPNSGPFPLTVTDCLAAAHRNDYSSAEEIYGLPLANGQQVYVFVDGNVPSLGSSFTLEVTPSFLESEPNNSPYTASLLNCEITGSISSGTDVDFFALGTWPAGSRVFAMLDASAAKTTDFDLRITSTNSVLQYDDESNDILFGDRAPNIAGTILPAAPAFVRVNTASSSANEPYRLYAVVQPPLAAATVEQEPNNNLAAANSSPINYFFGSLSGPAPSTDVDVFVINASEGDLLFVSLDGDPLRNNTPIDAQLELLDSQGSVLVSVDNNPDPSFPLSSIAPGSSLTAVTPYSPGEALVYRVTSEGAYYVRISISPSPLVPFSATMGDYLLSISKNCFAGDRNASLPPVIQAISVPASTPENGVATLSGSFTDPDLSEIHSVIINWGDGQPVTNLFLGVSVSNFTADHLYANDPADVNHNYHVSVTVFDQYQNSASSTVLLKVVNVPPSTPVLNLSALTINENSSATLGVTFSDPGPLDAHIVTINWGDGSPNTVSNLAAGVFSVSATHLYRDDNPTGTSSDQYSISVTVADLDGGSANSGIAIRVNNVAPVLSNLAINSPIIAGNSATLTGNISDVGTLDSFSLNINWGDASPNTITNYPAGTTAFSVAHLYATGGTNRPVSVTLSDDDGGGASGSTTITVIDPAKPKFQSITRLGNGHIQVSLRDGTPGVIYKIQISSTLRANSWSTLTSRPADGSGNIVFEDTTTPLETQRFYRATWP